jgi:mitotic spindle assembly checkpoint protein MAD1
MYAPKGKMGLTLKFTSQEGHFGTMQMTGGMSRSEELGECRRFWIEERQSVPGFLAQVTTEMFEKTTVSQQFVYGFIGERGNLAELAIRMEGATESVC